MRTKVWLSWGQRCEGAAICSFFSRSTNLFSLEQLQMGKKKNTILSHCPTYSRIFYQLFLNIISTEYFLHTGGSISSKWFTETTTVQWMFSFVVCQVWWDALEGEGSPLTHFSIWECLFLFRLSNEVSIYTHEIKTLKKTLIQWVVLLFFFIIIIFCKKLYFNKVVPNCVPFISGLAEQ